jgi:hypothetical protein
MKIAADLLVRQMRDSHAEQVEKLKDDIAEMAALNEHLQNVVNEVGGGT